MDRFQSHIQDTILLDTLTAIIIHYSQFHNPKFRKHVATKGHAHLKIDGN